MLDGFPRTPAQADALAAFLLEHDGNIECVPFIDVSSEELVDRLGGRWTCKAEGHVFHSKYKPPKEEGKCDLDGSPLYQRKDDKPETVKQRIEVYFEQTAPLIDYYKEKGLLKEIDGELPIEEVTRAIMEVVACSNA